MTDIAAKKDRYTNFVDYVFSHCQQNKGFAARLRRADNATTEYQSWEILANFVSLEKPYQRLPFALVAASIAKSDHKFNGSLSLGVAIAKSFDDGNKSPQANARLRRLLACTDVEEACRILRPLLTLIQSKTNQPVDYAALLKDLSWFNSDPQKTKAKWAQQFYRTEDTQKEES